MSNEGYPKSHPDIQVDQLFGTFDLFNRKKFDKWAEAFTYCFPIHSPGFGESANPQDALVISHEVFDGFFTYVENAVEHAKQSDSKVAPEFARINSLRMELVSHAILIRIAEHEDSGEGDLHEELTKYKEAEINEKKGASTKYSPTPLTTTFGIGTANMNMANMVGATSEKDTELKEISHEERYAAANNLKRLLIEKNVFPELMSHIVKHLNYSVEIS